MGAVLVAACEDEGRGPWAKEFREPLKCQEPNSSTDPPKKKAALPTKILA